MEYREDPYQEDYQTELIHWIREQGGKVGGLFSQLALLCQSQIACAVCLTMPVSNCMQVNVRFGRNAEGVRGLQVSKALPTNYNHAYNSPLTRKLCMLLCQCFYKCVQCTIEHKDMHSWR